MGWQHYSLGLISTMAYPVLIGLLAWIFRKQIRRLLENLKSISYKDFNAQFGTDLQAVTIAVEQAATTRPLTATAAGVSEVTGNAEATVAPVTVWEEARAMVEHDPYAGVARAGREFSVVLARLAGPYGHPMTEVVAIQKLSEAKVIANDLVKPTLELVRLRNLLAQQPPAMLSPANAYQFIDTAQRLASKLDEPRGQ